MASELRVDRIVPVDGVPTNGGGGIVQVVQASTNTFVTINSWTAYADTGLSATITPKFATSKILVRTNHSVYGTSSNNFYWGIRYLRNSTVIFDPITNQTGPFDFGTAESGTGVTTRYWYDRCLPPDVLDSPNTTSAITYKTQAKTHASTASGTVRFQYDDGNMVTNGSSYITLMEISA
jgi:hypothetical protein